MQELTRERVADLQRGGGAARPGHHRRVIEQVRVRIGWLFVGFGLRLLTSGAARHLVPGRQS
jgi:Mg/Co/Ni transporter MgtE